MYNVLFVQWPYSVILTGFLVKSCLAYDVINVTFTPAIWIDLKEGAGIDKSLNKILGPVGRDHSSFYPVL